MFELDNQEIDAIGGANALDTTTGSFVPAQTFGQCLTAGAMSQWSTGSSSGGIFLTCAVTHLLD